LSVPGTSGARMQAGTMSSSEQNSPANQPRGSDAEASQARISDATTDWLNHATVKGRKVAVAAKADVLESQQKSLVGAVGNVGVTLKQLYRLVVFEDAKRGISRGGREKQVVSEREEEELELQRMGGGEFRVGSGKRGSGNVAYGVYCRPKNVEAVLGRRYKGLDPAKVVGGVEGSFTHDVLRRCHALDMHAMLVVMDNLSLKACQGVLRDELAARVKRLDGGQGRSEGSIESFVGLFDEARLSKEESFVDQKSGSIKKGTHIVLSSTPKAHLLVEAVSPGPIGRRTTTLLGMQKDPVVTASVFECFVGENAIDKRGGLRCLDGLVWCANGLQTDTRTNPTSIVCEVDDDGAELFGPFSNVENVSLLMPGAFKVEQERQKKPRNYLRQFMRA
jgi:hypothetical protein